MVQENSAQFPSTPARSTMPEWYPDLLESVSDRVTAGTQRAVAAINRELVTTYWVIGKDILERQTLEGWGSRVIDRLAVDLKQRFPGMRGFSARNLRYMHTFASTWSKDSIWQTESAQLSWSHFVLLADKVGEPDIRNWYALAAASEGWSVRALERQIEMQLYERSGRAVTNFSTTMPPAESDLAQEATKDPYVFDFVAITERFNERDLETQLVTHVQKFLLELGQGFAFVGEQVRLEIGDDEFFADLLFYHLKLRRYVVVELKATRFDPGFIGQLGMYMAAVDDLLGHEDDKPTVGLLLCKTKNNVVAEYALRSSSMPMGVAEWQSAITDSLPDELTSGLPSIETLEAELADDRDDDND